MDHYMLCDKILKECQLLEGFTLGRLKILYPTEDETSLHRVMQTLIKDGHIQNTIPPHFHITGEGVEFSKNGGYANQRAKDATLKELQDTKLRLDILNAERVYQ